MFDEINRQLTTAKERMRRKQKLDAMLLEATAIQNSEQQRLQRCRNVLASESKDVEKLESLSLTSLFYSVLGTKNEKLDEEKQEQLAAQLKFEEALVAVDEAVNEVGRVRQELSECETAESEYEQLMSSKQQLIADGGDSRATELLELSGQLGDLQADRKELLEAIRAGEIARDQLRRVQSELSSAENWGTWDMLGGGTLATMAKHSKIDEARRLAQLAQRDLRRFREELADADQRLQVTLNDIGGFSTFADYFFDGLIADWMVQTKVQNASAACTSAIHEVTSALWQCQSRRNEVETSINELTDRQRELVEQA